MNTKVILGIVAAAVVCWALFIIFNKKPNNFVTLPSTTSENATSTNEGTLPNNNAVKTSAPAINVQTGPTTQTPKTNFIAADSASLISTSQHPTITGTGNIAALGIVIKDSEGKGLVSTSDIELVNGHWSYTTPITLTPGTYSVVLFGPATPVTVSLQVKTQ